MKKADFIKVLINKTMLLGEHRHYTTCADAERTINSILECGDPCSKSSMGISCDEYEISIRRSIDGCVIIRWHDHEFMEAVTFKLSVAAFNQFCRDLRGARDRAEKAYFFKKYAEELDDMVRQAKKEAVAEERKRTSARFVKKASGSDTDAFDVYEVAKPWGDTLD